jgi:hypothetical protein
MFAYFRDLSSINKDTKKIETKEVNIVNGVSVPLNLSTSDTFKCPKIMMVDAEELVKKIKPYLKDEPIKPTAFSSTIDYDHSNVQKMDLYYVNISISDLVLPFIIYPFGDQNLMLQSGEVSFQFSSKFTSVKTDTIYPSDYDITHRSEPKFISGTIYGKTSGRGITFTHFTITSSPLSGVITDLKSLVAPIQIVGNINAWRCDTNDNSILSSDK